MADHSHSFVETFDGFLGYGLDRQSDENTVRVYFQKLSYDRLMKTILKRMTDEDLLSLNILNCFLKRKGKGQKIETL